MTASELGACFEELVIGLVIIYEWIAPICREQSIFKHKSAKPINKLSKSSGGSEPNRQPTNRYWNTACFRCISVLTSSDAPTLNVPIYRV